MTAKKDRTRRLLRWDDEVMPTRLHFYRENLGFSQEALGDFLGVNGKTVSRWELGLSRPQHGNLENILTFMEIASRATVVQTDRERALKKEVRALQSNITRLEGRITALKGERDRAMIKLGELMLSDGDDDGDDTTE